LVDFAITNQGHYYVQDNFLQLFLSDSKLYRK
jgi:hypothetical protein